MKVLIDQGLSLALHMRDLNPCVLEQVFDTVRYVVIRRTSAAAPRGY